jgi:DNA polymerase
MNNVTTTFFDDILTTLSIEAETAKLANISTEVLQEFNNGTGKQETPASTNNQLAEKIPVPMGAFDNRNQLEKARAMPTSTAQASFTAPPTSVQAPKNSVTPPNVAGMDMNSLFQTVMQCNMCELCSDRKNVVFGAGSMNADLMFIGEWPNRNEDQQGVPFVGEAGHLLTKMINAMQFSRSEVFLANIIKCHPPRNRPPEENEVATCLPYLRRQIEIISPKVIVLLGAVPLKYLMGITGITKMRGDWLDYKGIKVMPTFHPAYLLRNQHLKKEVWEDLQKVMALFGKTRSSITRR